MRTKVWNLALEGVGATEAVRTMVWNLALDAIGASSAFRIVFSQPGSDAVIDEEGRKPLTVERMRTNDEVRAILTEDGRPWARTTAVRTAAQADDLIIEIGRTDRSRVAGATDKTALAFVLARCMAELGQMSKQPDTDEADRRFETVKRKEEKARRAGGATNGKIAEREKEGLCVALMQIMKAGATGKRPPWKVKLVYDEDKIVARELMIAAGVAPSRETYPSRHPFNAAVKCAKARLKPSSEISPAKTKISTQ